MEQLVSGPELDPLASSSIPAIDPNTHPEASNLVEPIEFVEPIDPLLTDLLAEHQPSTTTERLLVESLARHHRLTQRALQSQEQCFSATPDDNAAHQRLVLLLRYQTVQQSAFHRSLNALLKLRRERANLERTAQRVQPSAAPTPSASVTPAAPSLTWEQALDIEFAEKKNTSEKQESGSSSVERPPSYYQMQSRQLLERYWRAMERRTLSQSGRSS